MPLLLHAIWLLILLIFFVVNFLLSTLSYRVIFLVVILLSWLYVLAMKCLHPRTKKVFDAYSGIEREITFPCGHCVACLHNQADSWCIRLEETASHCSTFIYDTLTLRDSSLEWIDYDDAYAYGIYDLPHECDKHLFGTGYKHSRPYSESIYSVRVPYLSKKTVSDWFKRGRDACNMYYKRIGVNKRVDMRYFAVLEYGPKWSRPHVHLLVFGVLYADWIRFWAEPWKRDFGYVKTKNIVRSPDFDKDKGCISRYVTKYINKGSFEVPLVKAGLQPRPWRCISHGIGKEYASSSRFDWLNAPRFQFYKHVYSSFKYREWSTYAGKLCTCVDKFSVMFVSDFSLNHNQISSLTSYYDSNGFPHALPRYYRELLLGRRANLLYAEVQNSILQDACERRYKEISRLASSLECSGSCEYFSKTYGIKLSVCARIMASFKLASFEKDKAISQAKGRYLKLKNHYYRPLRENCPNVILNC